MNEPRGPMPNPHDPTQFAPMNPPMMPQPGQVPPDWPPMPPNPPPHNNRRLIWVLLGLICLLTVAAVVLTVTLVGQDRHEDAQSTAAADSSEGRTVPVAALEGLLPPKDVIASAVNDPGIGLAANGEGIDTDIMVDADCQGITAVSGPVYAGSGWTATRWQRWNSPAEPDAPRLTHQVLMSVTSYPQDGAARAFYTAQSAAWQKCSGRIINARTPSVKDSPDAFWTVSGVTESGGLLQATTISEGGGGWSCHNALTVRNNVVVRICVCADTDSAAAAQTLLDSITAKIDGVHP